MLNQEEQEILMNNGIGLSDSSHMVCSLGKN